MLLRASSRLAGVIAAASAASASFAIIGGPNNIPALDTATSAFQYMGKFNGGAVPGTPISANWLVTAKHVAPGVGATFTNPDGSFTVAQVVSHPTADISLVRVTGAMTNFYDYGSAPLGSKVTLVGYGKTGSIGANPSGASNPNRERYIAHNNVDEIYYDVSLSVNGPEFAAYAYDLDNAATGAGDVNFIGSNAALSDEGGIADQDSGSGWFYEVGGRARLIAVSSGVGSTNTVTGFGTNSPYEYGDVGVGAALDPYKAWIFNTTNVQAVPEPASMLALGLGAAALLRRRKKA